MVDQGDGCAVVVYGKGEQRQRNAVRRKHLGEDDHK